MRSEVTFTPFLDPSGMLGFLPWHHQKGRVFRVVKKHFTEEQIAFALQQAESGTSVAEVIRKLGISDTDLPPVEEAVSWPRRRLSCGGFGFSKRRIGSSSSWWRT